MPLFRNLCVNLRVSLCDVPEYVSAQTLDFLDLAKNRLFPQRKLHSSHPGLSGWELITGGCSLIFLLNRNPFNRVHLGSSGFSFSFVSEMDQVVYRVENVGYRKESFQQMFPFHLIETVEIENPFLQLFPGFELIQQVCQLPGGHGIARFLI